MRRKQGELVPLETEILGCAAALARAGDFHFHGFALAKKLRDETGARSLTAHGTLYKALSRLEEAGLLESRWDDASQEDGRPRRRMYSLTRKGIQVYEEAAREAAPRKASEQWAT